MPALHLFRERFPDRETLLAATPADIGAELVVMMQGETNLDQFHAGNTAGTMASMYRGGDGGLAPVDPEVELAVSEGFAWAQGVLLIVEDWRNSAKGKLRLTRLGRDFTRDQVKAVQLRAILPSFMLHRQLRGSPLSIFYTGAYEAAVVEAFRQVEIRTRNAAGGDPHSHGLSVFHHAFNVDNGPLQDDRAPKAEREALRNLMAGAYGLMRNPAGHREVGLDDPQKAAEMMIVASHLLRLVDDDGII